MAFSLYALSNLQKVSSNIYLHPFSVNSAAQDFEINVVTIRSKMLAISTRSDLLAQNVTNLELAEAKARADLLVIKSSFLGDMAKVEQIESLLNQWHQKRDDAINLINNGQRVAGIKLIDSTDLDIFNNIVVRIDYVEDFAQRRAESYVAESTQLLAIERNALIGICILITLVIAVAGYHTTKYVRQFHQLSVSDERVRQLNSLLIAIRRINEHLLVSQNEAGLYEFVCKTLCDLNPISTSWVSFKSQHSTLEPMGWFGISKEDLLSKPTSWDDSDQGRGMLGIVVRENRTIAIDRVDNDPRLAPWREWLRKRDVKSCAGIPLVYEGEVIGGLVVFSNYRSYFDEEILKFLTEVVGDIAIGIRNIRQTQKLNATLDSLATSLTGTIETIANIVEQRDPYTAGHERRVAQLACAIGKEMGLPERQIDGLRVSGFLHDLGKISVPAEILSKPSRLSDVERMLVMQHPQSGFNMLKNLEFPWPTAQTILQHHERLDGSGYPNGLKGDQIILEARVLMVADVVEAISSHRPYRPGLGIDAALDEIISGRGTHYDPKVVDACVALFRQKNYVIPD